MNGLARAAFAAGVLALGGCSRSFLNTPLTRAASNASLLPAPPLGGEPYIVIAFSGGGVRASALAWAVLRELAQVKDAAGHRLTDDIRIVSSASGGSVTAAMFGWKGDAGMQELHDNFLVRDNMAAMELTALSPVTWARLASPSFSRIDVFREYLDKQLFQGTDYAGLYAWPQRSAPPPIVLLNATNMGSGEVFSFKDTQFDDICSDLSRFPIAGAVASSAAFPILLTPISLKNYSTTPGCPVNRHPLLVTDAFRGHASRFQNLPKYELARETDDLLSGRVQYVHLLDGGLVDNLGVSSILQELFTPTDGMTQIAKLNNGQIRNLVAIEVVARSADTPEINTRPATPGLLDVAGAVINNPIDSATRGNAANFEDTLDTLRQLPGLPNLPDRIYAIKVDPEQFSRTTEDQDLRQAFESIPTSWTIETAKANTTQQMTVVQQTARQLLYAHPCFVRLLSDMAGTPASDVGSSCQPVRHPAN